MSAKRSKYFRRNILYTYALYELVFFLIPYPYCTMVLCLSLRVVCWFHVCVGSHPFLCMSLFRRLYSLVADILSHIFLVVRSVHCVLLIWKQMNETSQTWDIRTKFNLISRTSSICFLIECGIMYAWGNVSIFNFITIDVCIRTRIHTNTHLY